MLVLVIVPYAETSHACLGMYKSGSFTFSFAINSNYPHEPPKVKCIPKVCIAYIMFTWV